MVFTKKILSDEKTAELRQVYNNWRQDTDENTSPDDVILEKWAKHFGISPRQITDKLHYMNSYQKQHSMSNNSDNVPVRTRIRILSASPKSKSIVSTQQTDEIISKFNKWQSTNNANSIPSTNVLKQWANYYNITVIQLRNKIYHLKSIGKLNYVSFMDKVRRNSKRKRLENDEELYSSDSDSHTESESDPDLSSRTSSYSTVLSTVDSRRESYNNDGVRDPLTLFTIPRRQQSDSRIRQNSDHIRGTAPVIDVFNLDANFVRDIYLVRLRTNILEVANNGNSNLNIGTPSESTIDIIRTKGFEIEKKDDCYTLHI